MSEQLEKLKSPMPFGKVHLKTEKFRRKFYLPPSCLLDTLSGKFQGADYDRPIPLTRISEFSVQRYLNGARYVEGHTVYKPELLVQQNIEPLNDSLLITIQASDNATSTYYDDLDVDKDDQSAYELRGYTLWPEYAVTQRIAEHDRLLDIGKQLIWVVQNANSDRDLSTYTAQKVRG